MAELKKQVQTEHSIVENLRFKELLKKAEYVINRIKSKAAQPYGAPVYSPSIQFQKPMSPTDFSMRSWHFDISASKSGTKGLVDSISSSKNPLKAFDVHLIDQALREESLDETEEVLS